MAVDLAAVPPHRRLHQVLGVAFGITVIIGNTIGAGILRTPGDIAARLPNVWWFLGVWVLGGIYVTFGAICLAELATMIPSSGGQYVFARRALGEYAGFIVGWSDWLSVCGTTALVSIVIGEYSRAVVANEVAVALTVTVAFALLQWRGIKWGSRTQEITGFLKTLAFVALVVACFVVGRPDRTGEAAATTIGFAALMLSLQAVIYTYDGWNGIVYFSEEVKNPGRDIPRSLLGGVFSIIAIYLAVNLALVYLLPLSKIAGENLAVGTAATAAFGAYGDPVIRTLMVISMISGINAYHLMASRVLFAMSRDGLVTTRAATVNPGGTPTVALFASTAVAVAFILTGTFNQVIAVLAFFFVANYTLSFTSLFVLRRREPDVSRPYRAWGYPWTAALALGGSVAFLLGAIYSDTRNSVYALVLLALSYPAYRLLRRTHVSS